MNDRKRHRVMAALPVGTGSARPASSVIHAVKPVDASDALETAVVWLGRLASGLDERGVSELKLWLDADEVHRCVFFEMAEIYDDLNALSLSPAWAVDATSCDENRSASKLV